MPPPKSNRRAPQQTRSKDRVERLLGAARELIGERGNDAVSLREVAAHANVSIATVYDYFPDRNAIIRRLMVGYLSRLRERFLAILREVKKPLDVPVAADAMVDSFVTFYREERELGAIWSAVQANTELRARDVEDGRRIADLIATKFKEAAPNGDAEGIESLTLYVVDTVVSTARLAVYNSPKDGPRVIAELKCLMRLRLGMLIPELGSAPRKSSRQKRHRRS